MHLEKSTGNKIKEYDAIVSTPAPQARVIEYSRPQATTKFRNVQYQEAEVLAAFKEATSINYSPNK